MATIEQLMQANLMEVFNQRDGEQRRAAISRTYAPAVQFSDPDEVVTGHEALDAKAQKVLDGAPGFVFTPAGPIQVSHDLGYLAWGFGPEGQPPVVRGTDIALVEDGFLESLGTPAARPIHRGPHVLVELPYTSPVPALPALLLSNFEPVIVSVPADEK